MKRFTVEYSAGPDDPWTAHIATDFREYADERAALALERLGGRVRIVERRVVAALDDLNSAAGSSRPPLTDDETRVLAIVSRQCRLGDPVATRVVKDLARHRVDRQLRSLVVKGYIRQMATGYWLPSPAVAPDDHRSTEVGSSGSSCNPGAEELGPGQEDEPA